MEKPGPCQCSFCGRHDDDLVVGDHANICERCACRIVRLIARNRLAEPGKMMILKLDGWQALQRKTAAAS